MAKVNEKYDIMVDLAEIIGRDMEECPDAKHMILCNYSGLGHLEKTDCLRPCLDRALEGDWVLWFAARDCPGCEVGNAVVCMGDAGQDVAVIRRWYVPDPYSKSLRLTYTLIEGRCLNIDMSEHGKQIHENSGNNSSPPGQPKTS